MSEATEQVEALSRAVLSTDAGRRVGWARAYSAEASKDDLSREVNIARVERDIMRRAASMWYGFISRYHEGTPAGPATQRLFGGYVREIGAVLDPEVVKAGREAADIIRSEEPNAAARQAERAAHKATRRTLANQSSRLFKQAREAERKALMKRYGFANEAALLNYLEQYPGRP